MLLQDPNVTSVLVLDDDSIFSCTFASDLRKLLKEPRCGSHISSDSEHSGVLMLGSSIWLNGTYPLRGPWASGWNIVDGKSWSPLSKIAMYVLCLTKL